MACPLEELERWLEVEGSKFDGHKSVRKSPPSTGKQYSMSFNPKPRQIYKDNTVRFQQQS